MSTEILSAFEGLDQAVIDAISTPEVLARLSGYVEKAKTPVLSKNTEVLGQLSDLKKQINDLGGFDTLKTLSQQATDARRAQEEALAKSGDVEAIRKQAADALTAKDTELNTLKQSVVTEKVSSAVAKAVREAKGDADLMSPHIASRVQGVLEDGKVVIKVLDAAGQQMLNKDMKPASIADLVNEYKTAFPRAFDADGKSGSGAKSADASASGMANPFLGATRNLSKQNEIARTNPEMAKSLAAAAGITLNI